MARRFSRIRIAVLLALAMLPLGLFSGGLVGAAPAAQAGLTVNAVAGYGGDGSYLIGAWFPVRVTLTNPNGAPSMRVRVEVDSTGTSFTSSNGAESTYGREVDLPSPSRKEITLYTHIASFDRSITLRVKQGSTVIATKSVSVNPYEQSSNSLVGVISQDASLLNALNGEHIGHAGTPYNSMGLGYLPSAPGGPVQGGSSQGGIKAIVLHLSASDIPDVSIALDGLSALALDGVDSTSLKPEQQQAIAAWVARGGTLIVAAQPGGPTAPSDLANLLPVTPAQGVSNLSDLSGLADAVAVPLTLTGQVEVAQSTLRTDPAVGARLLASQEGVPLAAIRTLGEGQVAYLALSPATPPLKNWDGLVPLFKRLLIEHNLLPSLGTVVSSQPYYGTYGPGVGIFDMPNSIFDLPGLDLPDPLLLGLFLLLYIAIIGPLNFIILRRIGRTELAWVTVPALIVLFSVGAYILGYSSKGGDIIVIKGNVTYTAPELHSSSATQIWGLFSPGRGSYTINLGANSVVSQFALEGSNGSSGPTQVLGGDTTSVQNVIVNPGSLKAFVSQSAAQADSPLETDLRLEDSTIKGTVKNRTNHALSDVVLIRGDAVQYLGFIGAGSSVDVNLALSSAPFDNSTPTRVLPPPPGVVASAGSGQLDYYGSARSLTPEQRAYNRKISLLSLALLPLLSDDSPTDMSVLAVAWGGDAPVSVDVDARLPHVEELNLWTSRLPVTAGTAPKLASSMVPSSVYAPGNTPDWQPGSQASSVTLKPYADAVFRLPAGVKPSSVSVTMPWPLPGGVDLLAYNVATGKWDKLTDSGTGGQTASGTSITSLVVPNPGDYAGPAGDVTLRLLASPGVGQPSIQLSGLGMSLNATQ